MKQTEESVKECPDMNKSKKRFHDLLLYAVIGIYLFILIVLLFFKASSLKSVNLIPFQFIVDYWMDKKPLAISNVLGNVALFVPMGIYLTTLNTKRRGWMNMLLIVLFSALVELMQFVFAVGVTDIDDLLLNAAGGFLGICCGWGMRKIFRANTRYAVAILSLVVLCTFAVLYVCLYFGVFGFKIRIL